MSKPIKGMIVEEYKRRFEGLDGGVIVDVRGIEAGDNDAMRASLRTESVRITVVKNTLAKKAFADTALDGLEEALDGPSALAYGGESVVNAARAVVDWAKKLNNLDLKGAILDGTFFEGEAGVIELSKYPTRDEAQAKVVQLVLSPAQNVVGGAVGPGSAIMGIVKEIESRLEDGTAIAKVG